jgi:RNA polymerase sigma factor (sigma-70 family)
MRQKSGEVDERENNSATILPSAKQQLLLLIETQTGVLLGVIRSYVSAMGLATGEDVPALALDVLQETVLEALAHSERFDPQRPCMAWLLGIALNIVRRKKATLIKQRQHEVQPGQFMAHYPGVHNEAELFEQLSPSTCPDPAQEVEEREQASLLLALVSQEDQRVLRLALLEGFEHAALAQQLGLTPGAARVRLHRALNRLRRAWLASSCHCENAGVATERRAL